MAKEKTKERKKRSKKDKGKRLWRLRDVINAAIWYNMRRQRKMECEGINTTGENCNSKTFVTA